MAEKHWDLDDIKWDTFDSSKVDPGILQVVKAAAMVEYNGGDYATYLCNVFPDDPKFQAEAKRWAAEECQHGEALGRWAEMADPSFDFQGAFKRFIQGFRPDLETTESIRGSRSAELVARCIVEVGTSGYYSALADATDEPVLKDICKRIAADELRHYKLFYTNLRRYLEREQIGKLRRLMIALSRINETEDDELAYAYYAANAPAGTPYDRKRWSNEYMSRAFSYYRPKHVERSVLMTWKAAGLNPQSTSAKMACKAAYWLLKQRTRRHGEMEQRQAA
jgi:rubrerythrin